MNNFRNSDKGSKKPFKKKPFKKENSGGKSYGKSSEKSFDKKNDKPYKKSDKKPFRKSSDETAGNKKYSKHDDSDFQQDKPKSKSFDKTKKRTFDSKDKKPYQKSTRDSFKSRSSKFRNNQKDDAFDEVFFDDKEIQEIQEEKSAKKSSDRRAKKPYKKFVPKNEIKESSDSDGLRLNKYIANSGICSRREADQLISTGAVTVNGAIVTELGTKVTKKDTIKVDDRVIKPERNIYLLLNKPKDFITTSKDPQERRTVMQLVERACEQRIYPVGRLDRMTTGVLLFTNDGDLAKKLTHPKHKVKKIYHVSLDKPLSKTDMIAISEGVELEDGFTAVDEIAYPDKENKREVGIEIHSGKNRIVRRIFEHFGYQVVKLDRVLFAGLTKKNVPRGKWRILSEKEVILLKRQG